MNPILLKQRQAHEEYLKRQMGSVKLSANLVVTPEILFTEALADLRDLEERMRLQASNEGWAVQAEGDAYRLLFIEQRRLLAELIAFESVTPSFQPLADGQRLLDYIRFNGNDITRHGMHRAWIAIKSLDDIKPAELPRVR
jgi:hypothetical protein